MIHLQESLDTKMYDEITNHKNILRKQMKRMRNDMDSSSMFSKSQAVLERIVVLNQYRNSEKIFTYVSSNNEVDTIMLIDYSLSIEKRVFVPKVIGKEMLFYEITDISELSPGYMGIFEPSTDGKEPDCSKTGLICMPGLAFDRNKNRLGYGGGYFDRYLAGDNSLYKVALAYDFQILDYIPNTCNDIRPDMVITESEWF